MSAMRIIMSPKGTKVMRATSLVMSILLRKHRKIRVKASPRAVSTRESTRAAMAWNTFCRRSPSTMSMRQNRMIRVS